MTYAKRLLSVFSLCLLSATAALALATAPALAAGDWRVSGKNIFENVGFEVGQDSSFYGFSVPSKQIELRFGKISADGGTLSPEGTGTVTLLLTEGSLFVKGVLDKNCSVGNLTFNLKMSLFLHAGKTYLYLEPASGEVLTITTYKGELCSLPEQVVVKGSMVLETVGGTFEEEAVTHSVRQAVSGELFPGKTMLFGTSAMSMLGTWTMQLSSGLKWSGLG